MRESEEKKSSKPSFLTDLLLGGISGTIAKTASAPLERVKLLLQTQHSNSQLTGNQFKGLLDCTYRIWKTEGFFSFWRGNWPNVIRYFPTTAFNFAFKDKLTRLINRFDAKENPYKFFLASLVSGGLAGVGSTLIVHPLELARTRLGVDVGSKNQTQFRSMTHCLSSIYTSNGPVGLYQGLGASLVSIFTYRAMYFGSWDTAKAKIEDFESLNLLIRLMLAQTITTVSETINYPLDTIRRRMMMNAGLSEKLYSNSLVCARRILRDEGIKGFYKGCASNAVRSVSSSVVLVIYDELTKTYRRTLRN